MEQPIKKPKRGFFLLPNLLTTTALLAGFYAILAATDGEFVIATVAIFIAMVMDTLDGRVARLTNTQTEFGAQYDSLSDLVGFGLAPALVGYMGIIKDLGKIGWAVAFLYVASAALRLARFNVQKSIVDKTYFRGLPSPAAAGLITSFVALIYMLEIKNSFTTVTLAGLTAFAGVCMVSAFPYYSFKEINWRERVPFIMIWAIVLIFVGISLDPPIVVFTGFFVYALSGPVLWIWRRYKK
jgi:CDP-diacylglycerol--serine O-phosphatidyltransferase